MQEKILKFSALLFWIVALAACEEGQMQTSAARASRELERKLSPDSNDPNLNVLTTSPKDVVKDKELKDSSSEGNSLQSQNEGAKTAAPLSAHSFSLTTIANSVHTITLNRTQDGATKSVLLNQIVRPDSSEGFVQGVKGVETHDVLTQSGAKLLDILVVMDVSISMSQEAKALAGKFADLVRSVPNDVDYQIKVIPHRDIEVSGQRKTNPLLSRWADCNYTDCAGHEIPIRIIRSMINGDPRSEDRLKDMFGAAVGANVYRRLKEGINVRATPTVAINPIGICKDVAVRSKTTIDQDSAWFQSQLNSFSNWVDVLLYSQYMNKDETLMSMYKEEYEFFAVKQAMDCSNTWLRDKADVAIVFVSDQDDVSQSVSPETSTVDNFIAFLRAPHRTKSGNMYSLDPKTSLKPFVISQLKNYNSGLPSGPPDNGCQYAVPTASDRYLELIQKIGTVAAGSICGDYSQILQGVSANIGLRFHNRFSLSAPPSTFVPFQFSPAYSGACTPNGTVLNCTAAPAPSTTIVYNSGRDENFRSTFELKETPEVPFEILVTSPNGTLETYFYNKDFTVNGKRITFKTIPPDHAAVDISYKPLSNKLPTILKGMPAFLKYPEKIVPPQGYAVVGYDDQTGDIQLDPAPADGAVLAMQYWQENFGIPGPLEFDLGINISNRPDWTSNCVNDLVYTEVGLGRVDVTCQDVVFSASVTYETLAPDISKDTLLANPDNYDWVVQYAQTKEILPSDQWVRNGSLITVFNSASQGKAISFIATATPIDE